MKTTAAITLCALTVSLAACTTTDETPPGSVAGLAEVEESDEEEGIPEVDELDPSSEVSEDGEAMTQEPADGAEATAEPDQGDAELGENGEREASGGPYPTADDMTDAVCEAFFAGAAPLAARADDARLLVAQGAADNISQLEAQQIDVLAQQLNFVGAEGSEEQVVLFEQMNAPFLEVVAAAEEAGDASEITYEDVDTAESEAAQLDFTNECIALSPLG
ncbi:MAG: hypothetical protein WA966_01285 [Ornithinimicrobium sp.]